MAIIDDILNNRKRPTPPGQDPMAAEPRRPLTGTTDPMTATLTNPRQPYAFVESANPAAAAPAYQNRMDEIMAFSKSSPEIQHQLDSALANRQPTEQGRADAMAGIMTARAQPQKPQRADVRNAGDGLWDVTDPNNPRQIVKSPAKPEDPAIPIQQKDAFYRTWDDKAKAWGQWKEKGQAGGSPIERAFAADIRKERGLPEDTAGLNIDWSKIPVYGAPEDAAPTEKPRFEGADESAYEWAQANPDDPRAAAIMKRLGVR